MSVALADEPKNNSRVDEIFHQFDHGLVKTEDEGYELLAELKKRIDINDEVRQKLYVRTYCWNQKSETKELITKAIEYADKQLLIYATPIPSPIHTDLLLCRAWLMQYADNTQQALKDLDQAITSAYELEDPRLIADGRSIRGSLLSYQGNYSEALEDLIVSLQLYESLNIDYWAKMTLSDLATTYRRFGDPQTALKYQNKLEETYLKNNNFWEANEVNVQIAFSLDELGLLDDAIKRFQKSQQYSIKQKQPIQAADMAVNMAGILIKQNKINQALVLLTAAEKEIPADSGGAFSYMHYFLAQAYLGTNELDKATHHIDVAIKSFGTGKNDRGLNNCYILQSQILYAQQQWQQAYERLNHYVNAHLSLDKKIMSDRNAEMQARFDTGKITSENEELLQSAKDKELQIQIMRSNDAMQVVIIILVAFILIIVSIFAYRQVIRKQRFKLLALTDELTGLSNRRDTYDQGNHFLKQAKTGKKPFSVILFDADHFKQVNDKLGHETGDKVLIKLAEITSGMMRENDVVGRVGGEEFLILLPNIDLATATEIANRLIETIANYQWNLIDQSLHQTVSAGVASYKDETQLSPLLLKADKALYTAKATGRNRVESMS